MEKAAGKTSDYSRKCVARGDHKAVRGEDATHSNDHTAEDSELFQGPPPSVKREMRDVKHFFHLYPLTFHVNIGLPNAVQQLAGSQQYWRGTPGQAAAKNQPIV